jgi:hypothetical protein
VAGRGSVAYSHGWKTQSTPALLFRALVNFVDGTDHVVWEWLAAEACRTKCDKHLESQWDLVHTLWIHGHLRDVVY